MSFCNDTVHLSLNQWFSEWLLQPPGGRWEVSGGAREYTENRVELTLIWGSLVIMAHHCSDLGHNKVSRGSVLFC